MRVLALTRPNLQLRSDQAPPIQRNRSTINKRPSPTTQKQTSPRHILRTPDPSQRNTRDDRLPKALQRCRHHLALKRPTCKRITRNIPLPEMIRKDSAQLMQSRL